MEKMENEEWRIKLLLLLLVISIQTTFSMQPPELPGIEITDAEMALEQSKVLVQSKEAVDVYKDKGWIAPSLEEQLNADDTFIGMGRGAIFVPRFTESRLEPEYKATKIDSSSKEYYENEWYGKHGIRLTVPPGEYLVVIGSTSNYEKNEYTVKVDEGKTTTIPPDWGGLVINTINEDGEFISENYEIFSVNSGKSYGKGFGLTQERVSDIKTWILPPQVYRISRNGESVSSLSNYITVQVNPAELTSVEIVFEESTGRLIAGGVNKMRINKTENTYWTYGLRLGGSASYTSFGAVKGKKNNAWNVLGDIRLRTIYNRAKVFWLTELYARENMQWLKEEQKESQWSVAQDLLQFQSSGVYKYYEWVGPYTRINAKSHAFPEYYWIDEDNRILIGRSFDPVRLGEGVGINFTPVISNFFDISAQSGFAARQTIRKNLRIPTNTERTAFALVKNNLYEYGWENSLNMRFVLSRFVTLDLIGEVFLPNAKLKDYVVEELSLDWRLALTRFLEFSWQAQLYDRTAMGMEQQIADERFEMLNTLQLRLYVNF